MTKCDRGGVSKIAWPYSMDGPLLNQRPRIAKEGLANLIMVLEEKSDDRYHINCRHYLTSIVKLLGMTIVNLS